MTDIYLNEPSVRDQSGDIWRDIAPRVRWWGNESSAIVVTPACDLANGKCEWVTFVPVVPVREWLLSKALYREILQQLKDCLTQLSIQLPISLESLVLSREHERALDALAAKIGSKLPVEARASNCIRVLKRQIGIGEADVSAVAGCFPKDGFERLVRGITGNSFRGDVHFLPADGKVHPYSAMENDSLALFRYVFSLPIEILIAANSREPDWAAAMRELRLACPALQFVDPPRPIKVGVLLKVHHSDLISRFVANQVRLGVPDIPELQHEAACNRIRSA